MQSSEISWLSALEWLSHTSLKEWREPSTRTLLDLCTSSQSFSMLDGALFDTLEALARRVRGSAEPFGGLQLVLCGDFFQLPPVAKQGAPFKFAFEAESWGRCVQRSFELTKVFRQSDPEFVEALRMVRLGQSPPAVRDLLKQCARRELPADDGIAATRLFTHRADCERLNFAELQKLPGSQLTFSARDVANDESALRQLQSSCPAPAELRLKVGAQVILTKTLDADTGLVNGARGVVLKLLQTRNPLVRFNNGCEQIIRLESFSISQGGVAIATRTQLPLAFGWALSIHKSQGMTLDRVQISLSKGFECGQMYVALSRARALEGLSLLDVDWSKLRAHPKVLAWHAAQQAAARERDAARAARDAAPVTPQAGA